MTERKSPSAPPESGSHVMLIVAAAAVGAALVIGLLVMLAMALLTSARAQPMPVTDPPAILAGLDNGGVGPPNEDGTLG